MAPYSKTHSSGNSSGTRSDDGTQPLHPKVYQTQYAPNPQSRASSSVPRAGAGGSSQFSVPSIGDLLRNYDWTKRHADPDGGWRGPRSESRIRPGDESTGQFLQYFPPGQSEGYTTSISSRSRSAYSGPPSHYRPTKPKKSWSPLIRLFGARSKHLQQRQQQREYDRQQRYTQPSTSRDTSRSRSRESGYSSSSYPTSSQGRDQSRSSYSGGSYFTHSTAPTSRSPSQGRNRYPDGVYVEDDYDTEYDTQDTSAYHQNRVNARHHGYVDGHRQQRGQTPRGGQSHHITTPNSARDFSQSSASRVSGWMSDVERQLRPERRAHRRARDAPPEPRQPAAHSYYEYERSRSRSSESSGYKSSGTSHRSQSQQAPVAYTAPPVQPVVMPMQQVYVAPLPMMMPYGHSLTPYGYLHGDLPMQPQQTSMPAPDSGYGNDSRSNSRHSGNSGDEEERYFHFPGKPKFPRYRQQSGGQQSTRGRSPNPKPSFAQCCGHTFLNPQMFKAHQANCRKRSTSQSTSQSTSVPPLPLKAIQYPGPARNSSAHSTTQKPPQRPAIMAPPSQQLVIRRRSPPSSGALVPVRR